MLIAHILGVPVEEFLGPVPSGTIAGVLAMLASSIPFVRRWIARR